MNVWPPNPGFTDMIRTRSTSGRISSIVCNEVAGFSVTPGLDPSFLDRLHGAMEMRTGFHMNGQIVRSRCGKLGDERVGIRDHEMDVERKLGDFSQRFDDGRADSQVRHEMSVHDVNVEQIGSASLDGGHFVGQAGKVSRKNGGSNERWPGS